MADDGSRVIDDLPLGMVSPLYNVSVQKKISGCV